MPPKKGKQKDAGGKGGKGGKGKHDKSSQEKDEVTTRLLDAALPRPIR